MAAKAGDIKYHKTTGDKVVILEIKPNGKLVCRLADRSIIEYYDVELQDTDPRNTGGISLDLYN